MFLPSSPSIGTSVFLTASDALPLGPDEKPHFVLGAHKVPVATLMKLGSLQTFACSQTKLTNNEKEGYSTL